MQRPGTRSRQNTALGRLDPFAYDSPSTSNALANAMTVYLSWVGPATSRNSNLTTKGVAPKMHLLVGTTDTLENDLHPVPPPDGMYFSKEVAHEKNHASHHSFSGREFYPAGPVAEPVEPARPPWHLQVQPWRSGSWSITPRAVAGARSQAICAALSTAVARGRLLAIRTALPGGVAGGRSQAIQNALLEKAPPPPILKSLQVRRLRISKLSVRYLTNFKYNTYCRSLCRHTASSRWSSRLRLTIWTCASECLDPANFCRRSRRHGVATSRSHSVRVFPFSDHGGQDHGPPRLQDPKNPRSSPIWSGNRDPSAVPE